ncbi:FRG domain protein [bacterium BMS3Abin05]|nr:FRG domain protein [bacterium BMS3Abin05]
MNKSWNILPELKLDEFKGGTYPPLQFFDYLVFLRHHGFPSPLLDWTESPYIAAYFAFSDKIKNADRVAIYAYIERIPGHGKGGWVGAPLITTWDPRNKMHIRHFAQKARYTTATTLNKNGLQMFCHHEKVFNKNKKQDVLTKITIPVSDRIKALKELSDYNINHFTLFQTEDSLVKTIAIRELDINLG